MDVDAILEHDGHRCKRVFAHRAHVRHARDAVHCDFHRERDEALDLHGRQPRRLHQNLHLHVGQVRERLNAERPERPRATDDERENREQNGCAAADRPGDQSVDHGVGLVSMLAETGLGELGLEDERAADNDAVASGETLAYRDAIGAGRCRARWCE